VYSSSNGTVVFPLCAEQESSAAGEMPDWPASSEAVNNRIKNRMNGLNFTSP
jgi:hypothetical protein